MTEKSGNSFGIGKILQIGALVSMTVAALAYFETAENAEQRERESEERLELAATDREVGDLRTRLRLVRIELARYRAIAETRPLTEGEKIDVRALEAELSVLLARLQELGEA